MNDLEAIAGTLTESASQREIETAKAIALVSIAQDMRILADEAIARKQMGKWGAEA